jgi:hypothetical protein
MPEILRVQDKLYWPSPGTGRDNLAEGTPVSTASHPATARLTADSGQVLAGRDELAASVAALGGKEGESMDRATRQAERHAARLIAQAADSGRKGPSRRRLADAGLDAVAEMIGRYRSRGRPVTGQEAAWLTVVLRDLRVRDDAWARMDPVHQAAAPAAVDRPDPPGAARVRAGPGVAAGLHRLAVRQRRARQRRAGPGAGR